MYLCLFHSFVDNMLGFERLILATRMFSYEHGMEISFSYNMGVVFDMGDITNVDPIDILIITSFLCLGAGFPSLPYPVMFVDGMFLFTVALDFDTTCKPRRRCSCGVGFAVANLLAPSCHAPAGASA